MMVRIPWAAGIIAACAIGAGTGQIQSPPSRYSLRWVTRAGAVIVRVYGVPPDAQEALRGWDTARWNALLTVYSDSAAPKDSPIPMAGRYAVTALGIDFTPAFPLQRGVQYYAHFRPEALPDPDTSPPILAGYFRPRAPSRPAYVKRVYPSADRVPANLLKFYVHFSAPMSRGGIYEHIRVLDERGKEIDLPFLEVDEELWNPEMTRVTLIIDPGRIKRGVKPLEDIGPALEAGKGYTLVIRGTWRDAGGNPLVKEHRKEFRAEAADRKPIDLKRWRIRPPKAGTRNPLTVDFGESIDHALGIRLLSVTAGGVRVPGTPALTKNESRWAYTPDQHWKPGLYELVAGTKLEDLAGNNIGKPFEVDVFKTVQRRLTSGVVRLPFRVR